MKIQSLSIAVPGRECINKCKFCVSRMHCEEYVNRIDTMSYDFPNALNEYLARLNYARDNGCNAVMLTGNCEPQQNRNFLKTLGFIFRMMDNPFHQIEIQTTGSLLTMDYLKFLRDWVGVTTISISVSSFNVNENNDIIGAKGFASINLPTVCKHIKYCDFNLRLSINLTDAFADYSVAGLLNTAKEQFFADQVTLRKIYTNNSNTPQDRWVQENTQKIDNQAIKLFFSALSEDHILRKLEYGQTVYSINGMSVVYDDDCMAKALRTDELKYLILRPDCKLYSQWDSKASLIF